MICGSARMANSSRRRRLEIKTAHDRLTPPPPPIPPPRTVHGTLLDNNSEENYSIKRAGSQAELEGCRWEGEGRGVGGGGGGGGQVAGACVNTLRYRRPPNWS